MSWQQTNSRIYGGVKAMRRWTSLVDSITFF